METVMAAFGQAVENYVRSSPRSATEPLAELDGKEMPLGALARIVIGLHQDMPESLCATLGVPHRSAYSTGAKRVLELLRQRGAS